MIVEAGHVAPALVAADLDESCAEHDAKTEPAEKQYGYDLRAGLGTAEKYRIEPRFEQNGFPAESVEGLADVDEGNVEQPERPPYGGREQCRVTIRYADDDQAGEHDSEPCGDGEYGVLRREVEEAREIHGMGPRGSIRRPAAVRVLPPVA